MNANALSLLQKSQFEQTSLDRAVNMTKNEMRDEAADELAALRARIVELEHLLFLVESPLEMYVEEMGKLTNPTKQAAEDALALIRAALKCESNG